MGTDYRDLVIAEFADNEANLLELAWKLGDDVVRYRRIVTAAVDALQTLHRRQTHITADRDRLQRENADLRADLLIRAGADDEAA